MLDFIRAGGVVAWIVLLFGGITFVSAALFMWRPREDKIPFIRAFTWSTVFAVLSGVCAGFGAVMSKVPTTPTWAQSPDMPLIVMTGLGEAITSAIIGFTLLSLAWMITAIGIRRLGSLPTT